MRGEAAPPIVAAAGAGEQHDKQKRRPRPSGCARAVLATTDGEACVQPRRQSFGGGPEPGSGCCGVTAGHAAGVTLLSSSLPLWSISRPISAPTANDTRCGQNRKIQGSALRGFTGRSLRCGFDRDQFALRNVLPIDAEICSVFRCFRTTLRKGWRSSVCLAISEAYAQ